LYDKLNDLTIDGSPREVLAKLKQESDTYAFERRFQDIDKGQNLLFGIIFGVRPNREVLLCGGSANAGLVGQQWALHLRDYLSFL
jgi:hypothetical protein